VFDYRKWKRKSPATADYPNDDELHTIEKSEERYNPDYERNELTHVIYYKRTDEIRVEDGWYVEYRKPKNRASFKLYPNDDFILNFDAATKEELEYYLSHRQSRKSYATMIPVLERAIKLKNKEEQTEKPFRELLIGELNKLKVANIEVIESYIDDLIHWWKFKNREHRALTSDDVKAISQITKEFPNRLKKDAIRKELESVNPLVTDSICKDQSPVYIAHKADNKYVAYVPHNTTNIWVKEQLWTYNRKTNSVRMINEQEWRTVDKRHLKWKEIYKAERFDDWKINPVKSQILTDPEIESLVEEEKNRIIEKFGQCNMLRLVVNDKFKISMYYYCELPKIPKDRFITSKRKQWPFDDREFEIGMRHSNIEWEKSKSTVITKSVNTSNVTSLKYVKGGIRFPENEKIVAEFQKAMEKVKEKAEQLCNEINYVEDYIKFRVYEQRIKKAKSEYYAEYGDPMLWDDHFKTLDIKPRYFGCLTNATYILHERNISMNGKTVRWILEKAKAIVTNGDYSDRWHFEMPNDEEYPFDFVIADKQECLEFIAKYEEN